ncbi:MAG: hypothetical protein JRD94_19290 [Deltaproteobacteria bacterium]|nr:hypothetical protein [Deltaproteobacteria bacterium]
MVSAARGRDQQGRVGRFLARRLIRTVEALRIAPKGSAEVSKMLGAAAEALIAGGEADIFTPNYFFLAQRPAE